MAYIARRRTSGVAQELYNDLLANLANRQHYKDFSEFTRDEELLTMLASWLMTETKREAQMDE